MNTQDVTIDAQKERPWLPKAIEPFDAGQLRKVKGLTLADKNDIEDLLQHIKDRSTKTNQPPNDFIFNLDLAPHGLK